MKRIILFILLLVAIIFVTVSCKMTEKPTDDVTNEKPASSVAEDNPVNTIPDKDQVNTIKFNDPLNDDKDHTPVSPTLIPEVLPGVVASPDYPEGVSFEDFDTKRAFRDSNPVEEDFLEAVREFSYRTASEILHETDGNITYSPLSFYYALALAGSGADSTTEEEILAILGLDSSEKLSAQCGYLYRLLYTDNDISKLKIANSLWLDKNAVFYDDYMENAVNNFYSSLFSVDFQDKVTAEIMSQWVLIIRTVKLPLNLNLRMNRSCRY